MSEETPVASSAISYLHYRYKPISIIVALIFIAFLGWVFVPDIWSGFDGVTKNFLAKFSTASFLSHQGLNEASDPEPSLPGLKIYVEVSGSVERPGLYQLSLGSRVGDLIRLSGGLVQSADTTWVSRYLNQAALLEDGTKLYVPQKGDIDPKLVGVGAQSAYNEASLNQESNQDLAFLCRQTVCYEGSSFVLGSSKSSSSDGGSLASSNTSSTGKVNANKASASELDTLAGIGPVTANKIISLRPFKSFDDFVTRVKLRKDIASNIKDKVSF